jgi:hypothetical protein
MNAPSSTVARLTIQSASNHTVMRTPALSPETDFQLKYLVNAAGASVV